MSRLLFLLLLVVIPSSWGQSVRLGDAPQYPVGKFVERPAVVSGSALPTDSAVTAADLPAVDVKSRESVRQFHLAQYLPDVAIGWTGSMSTGTAGTTSDAFKARVLQRINYFRALAGVSSGVTLDTEFSRKAQEAALMMSANGDLSHTPPADWKFYTADGAAAAGKSNLALGLMGAAAIEAYVDDYGDNNTPVGHRRWILHPKLTKVGTGDVPTISNPRTWAANALVVLDGVNNSIARVARDGYVAWPYPGFIPYRLVSSRFSVSHPNGDFANSVVTATHDNVPLEVTVESRGGFYGEGPAIVFNLKKAGRVLNHTNLLSSEYDKPIRISITNTRIGGQQQTIEYDVTPFDPASSGPSAPSLSLPSSLSATVGQAYSYQVVATGATSYSASGLPPGLSIHASTGVISGTPSSAGNYNVTVTVSNGQSASGSVTITVSSAPTPPPPAQSDTGRLINISTRSQIGTGENILIAGFVIEGSENKTVLIRGIGPALKGLGVNNAAGEIILRLNNGQKDIATNQGWSNSSDSAAIASAASTVGAFALAPGSGDSAILTTLPAGAYTALLSTPAGKEGIGLAEIYEVGKNGSRLINISSRAFAGTEAGTMIAGIVIRGETSRRVLVRAVGRSLTQFGINNPISKPVIQLVEGSDVLGTAGAWSTAPNSAEISAAFASVGAFPLTASNEDAAVIVTLEPGNYTALVTASPGTANGLCLIEAYELK